MDYKKMDTEALNKLLLGRIRELENEGLVDGNFRMCHSLKEDSGLRFFLELIPAFLADVCTIVKDMAKALDQPVVDYSVMYTNCIKLKGSSACFGACRIRDVCSKLCIAIDNKFIDGCLQALEDIKQEHTALFNQLDSIVKIEKELVSRAT